MNRRELAKFLILRTIGNFLLLFAIYGVIATFGPAIFFEVQYRIILARGIYYTVQEPGKPSLFGEILSKEKNGPKPSTGFSSVITGPKEQFLIAKDTDFSLVIPKIGATSKIFPNVDPTQESAFLPILQKGIAHAAGSVFPGMAGNIYLFAHSTDNFWDVGRYNAVFYLLKDLSAGDSVIVFFEGRRHNYTVSDSKIIDPQDVSYLVNSQKTGQERLILQTCWPPGTTWKRLLIIARPK